jgi:RNA polymerase sigma-70 factor, ECF subfamily
VLTVQPVAIAEAQIPAEPVRDETALIHAAQKGDQDAFTQIVRTYDKGVLRLATHLLRNPDDARDMYQEAFLRVYRNLNSFRFDCSFHTWLYRIVTNLCLDQLRRKKVRREEAASGESSEGTIDRMANMVEQSADGDPQRQLFNRELSGRIREVLDGLTPRERTVFELRHYEGLRLKAIGDILGSSEEAAKNCLFRVNQKMRAALGDFV